MGSVPPWPPGKGLWSPSELSLRPTQLPHLRGCPWPPAQSLLSFALLCLCGQGWTPCRSHSAQWSSGFPTPSSLSPSVLEQQKRLPICPASLGPTAGAGEHAPLLSLAVFWHSAQSPLFPIFSALSSAWSLSAPGPAPWLSDDLGLQAWKVREGTNIQAGGRAFRNKTLPPAPSL